MTRLDFYSVLPHEIYERAYRNTGKDMLKITCSSMSDALSGGFEWAESNEGFEFWQYVIQATWQYEDNLQKALQLIKDGHAIQS
jgi:hypothetical protein